MRLSTQQAIVAVLALLCATPVRAQAILNPAAVPKLDAAGRAAYAEFLLVNLPRAFAIGGTSAFGWQGGTGTIEQIRAKAIASCAERGAADCQIYAEDLDVVWQGRKPVTQAIPNAFLSTWNFTLEPDKRFLWHGAAAAAGVVLWAHGYGGSTADERGRQPQPHVRAFNNAGWDVVRFDRQPNADGDRYRTAGWMEESLRELRRLGYKRVVAAGQSRGAWNALQMLSRPGLADAVIAVSPAAHGSGGSTNLSAQYDDLRRLVGEAVPARTRVAFVQFDNDAFAGDPAGRTALVERLRPLLGGLLEIDRPAGFAGHYAGGNANFAIKYGPCLLHFVTDPQPADHC